MRHPVRLVPLFGGALLAFGLCAPAAGQNLGDLRLGTDDPSASDAGSDIWTMEDEAAASVPGDPEMAQDDAARSRLMPTGAIGPVQGGGATREDDPFSAPGVQLGSFVLRSTLDVGFSAKAETANTESGAPPVVTESTTRSLPLDGALALELESDWARHAMGMSVDGNLQRDLENGTMEPALSAEATGRLDIGADATLTGTLSYAYALDDPQSAAFVAATDPSLVPAVSGVNKPATQTVGGSLVLARDTGGLFGEVEIAATHEMYGDAELSDGAVISQSDLDNTVIDGRLRVGFHASPVFAPFVQGSYGTRRMVHTPDSGGYDRDAMRYALQLGTQVDLGEKLNGEIAAGYVLEDVADAALDDIGGISVAATVNWSPRRETDVSLGLSTTTETSGKSGEGGALVYAADLGVVHRARSYLTAEASLGVEYRDAESGADETTVSAEATFTHWFNRFAGLVTQFGHERVFSGDPLQRSTTTTARVGLRLQR
ncbi:outer membrane beta-barrel protein [Oricola sp.]|uniref:outer membrane beta-barrel protein n=1 Tax=Oricola sp. TaxID=1979950 RepID=UPI0025FDDF27|nr:outer membrane beta-barrel protein [Oricola sp.]MCI5074672.1 outer membrane beta-barrel protein [Oricola sp.]